MTAGNTQQQALLDMLISEAESRGGRHDRRRHDISITYFPCPGCGNDKEKFRFGLLANGKWFCHCKVCGTAFRMREWAAYLLGDFRAHAPQPRRERPQQQAEQAPSWQRDAQRLLQRYISHPEIIPLWDQYKRLKIETIARNRLGVGIVPGTNSHYKRLIMPVFGRDGTSILGFRGRAILPEDTGPKWLTAGGMRPALYNSHKLYVGCTVIVCENMADCLLIEEADSSVVAICSTHGVGTWLDEWTDLLVELQPECILVWFDHDLAGNGSLYHEREMLDEWRQRVERKRKEAGITAPFPKPPVPKGPRLVHELRKRKLNTHLYLWPQGTPFGYDVGSYLESQMVDV